jgi:CspA family cold shock protein
VSRFTGKVLWFNKAKGYGFIQYEKGQDIFVHHSAIVAVGDKTLIEGSRVDFDVEMGPSGRVQAVNVVPGGVPTGEI